MKLSETSEELTVIAIHELLAQTAQTIALIASRHDQCIAIPHVDKILMSELATALTDLGVPATVAADMMGTSRRSFFRKRTNKERIEPLRSERYLRHSRNARFRGRTL